VVGHFFGAIVGNIANLDSLFPAIREIDDIVPNSEPDDYPTFLEMVDEAGIDRNDCCQNRVCIFGCAAGVVTVFHDTCDQLDIRVLKELILERKIGVRRA
jgi:hypothetical protein